MTGWCCDYVCRIVIYPEQQCLSLEYMLGWEPYNVRYLHLVSRHRRPQRADGNLLETRSQHAVPSNLRSVKFPIPQCHIFNASTMTRKPGNCANPSLAYCSFRTPKQPQEAHRRRHIFRKKFIDILYFLHTLYFLGITQSPPSCTDQDVFGMHEDYNYSGFRY